MASITARRTRSRLTTLALAGAILMGGLLPVAAAAPSECPTGWFAETVPDGDLYDANGDNRICTKALPGDGEGNSANSQRGDGQTGFHVDGHNHKDNKA